MNERYMFRGKQNDNGEWVKGWYSIGYVSKNTFICENGRYYEVIPETVGQCVCIKDKNGTMIFEGDVVRYEDIVFRIGWNKFRCRFEGINKYDCGESLCQFTFNANVSGEVIGNVHDNPELMEVKE